MMNSIGVLVIDDSAVVRQTFSSVIEAEPGLRMIGMASDPIFAMKIMEKEWPDVIILDIEMPRMDGITFLKKIMEERPTPVIICSTLTTEGAEVAIQAAALGAIDIVTKPKIGVKSFIDEQAEFFVQRIKGAAAANVRKIARIPKRLERIVTKERAYTTTEKIIAIGASTGGTTALEYILSSMPRVCPGIVIVQHMPEGFTARFAERLNTLSELEIKEAADGDEILPGHAYIAHGNRHLSVRQSGARYIADVKEGPKVNLHRPSVDVLFRSVAKSAGRSAVGVILTGMGADGASGMLDMKKAGSFNIAQDEESCIVYGMPKSAVEKGAVDKILPLRDIPFEMLKVSGYTVGGREV